MSGEEKGKYKKRYPGNSTIAKHSFPQHPYSNILKISPPKTEHFQIKKMIFLILLLKT